MKSFLLLLTTTLDYLRMKLSVKINYICSYLGKSRIDRIATILMGREVAPDLPSDENTSTEMKI